MGSRGDSGDGALAEPVNGLYKAELVHRRGPWRGLEDLELATLEWAACFRISWREGWLRASSRIVPGARTTQPPPRWATAAPDSRARNGGQLESLAAPQPYRDLAPSTHEGGGVAL